MSKSTKPTMLQKGILLSAKWLIDYGQTTTAAYMIRDMGLTNIDCRRLEDQDKESLEKLNKENGIKLIL